MSMTSDLWLLFSMLCDFVNLTGTLQIGNKTTSHWKDTSCTQCTIKEVKKNGISVYKIHFQMCIPFISSKISSLKQSTNENEIFTMTSKYIIGN